jgi:predicted HTH transcriptional regulator
MALSEDDLLRLLHSTEHSFVERKTSGDHKDWVKTIVAFANSLDPSQEGVLFIGATNAGQIEEKPTDLDKLQMTLSEKTNNIYPSAFYQTRAVKEQGRECLAVIVPGSPAKPHFAGPPYLRDLSKTVITSTERYESLLAIRTSKAFELQKWNGRDITLVEIHRYAGIQYQVERGSRIAQVVQCNQFYLTLIVGGRKTSYPLKSFEISYDHDSDRLQIERTVPETRH